ncbi:MAG: fumarylacetoacetate hydrolase family protein [Bacillota bacterium]
MKLLRFLVNGEVRQGVLEPDNRISEISGSFYEHFTLKNNKYNLEEVKLLPPCKPTKIICVGLNYRDHAAEMNEPLPDEPVLFMKPSTAVTGAGDDIIYPVMAGRVDYEAELAVVIGRQAKDVAPEQAGDFILGYTCANDVTARDLQKKDGQWSRAKSFDTFLPLGPWIETGLDPSDLDVRAYLNGELKQHSNTRQLIFPVPELVSFVSRVMTLYPGDVIITGTPGGIGPMQPGDTITISVKGIGELTNQVAAG